MPHLGAGAKIAVLDFAKVAHVHAFTEMCALAEMAKRADLGACVLSLIHISEPTRPY